MKKNVFFLVVEPQRFYPPYTNGLVVHATQKKLFLCAASLRKTGGHECPEVIYYLHLVESKQNQNLHNLSQAQAYICAIQ